MSRKESKTLLLESALDSPIPMPSIGMTQIAAINLGSTLSRILLAVGGSKWDNYTANRSEGSRPRIMIVDDEKDIAWLFARGLQKRGFEVELYNDPAIALSKFKPNHYAMLVLDVKMPGMSGFELLSKIKEKDPQQKACFASGYEVHDEVQMDLLPDLDSDSIMKKPVTIAELEQRIRQELE